MVACVSNSFNSFSNANNFIFKTNNLKHTLGVCFLSACGVPGTRLCMKVKVKVTQSCLTLCNPVDYTVHGILQGRIPEWVAFPFSRGSSQLTEQTRVSRIAGRFFTS